MHFPSEPSRDCKNIRSRWRREACKVDPVMVAVNLPGICLAALFFYYFFFILLGCIRPCAVLYSKIEPQEVFIPALVIINSSTLKKHVHRRWLETILRSTSKYKPQKAVRTNSSSILLSSLQWSTTVTAHL